jgi:hypothetical protein
MRGIIVTSCLAAALACTACSRQESAWEAARRDNSPAAYADYAARFPAGAHAADARAAIRALGDDEAWARAERIGTPEAWQRYLADWPDGRHLALARQMLVDFIPPAAPGPPAIPEPSAAAFLPGAFEIQLGAWRDESTAREALASWQAERAGLLEGHGARLVAPFGDGPALWRLRTSPLDGAGARALCERIRAAGTDCIPAAAVSAGDPPP